jgi:hypothetical protein
MTTIETGITEAVIGEPQLLIEELQPVGPILYDFDLPPINDDSVLKALPPRIPKSASYGDQPAYRPYTGTPRPLIEPNAPRHSRHRSIKERAIRAGVKGVAGLVAIAGIAAFIQSQEGSPSVTVPKANVFLIKPATIDLRAEVDSCIVATASDSPSLLSRLAVDVMTNPVISWMTSASQSQSATFTGENGKGCGTIQTFVGANAVGVTTSYSKGVETFHIPGKDIEFISRPLKGKWAVENDDGTIHSIIGSGLKLTPFSSIKNARKLSAANVNSAALYAAVDKAEGDCGKVVAKDTEKAIAAGYAEVAKAKYDREIATGNKNHLAPFDKKNYKVSVEGSIHYPAHDSLLTKEGFKVVSQKACVEDPHALQLGGF